MARSRKRSLSAQDFAHYFTADTPVYVAYSGGIDSSVLLHLCVQLRNCGIIRQLHALHIHHGLHAEADQWSDHCLAMGTQWQVSTHIEAVQIDSAQEQAARDARYRVFARYLQSPALLLQAHHRNDQSETVLFRLLRGTGIRGLTGIPHYRTLAQGHILRPLLHASKAQIQDYAQQHQLTWVNDHSNQNPQFDRNFLRLKALPLLENRWPRLHKNIAAAAEQAQDAHHLLQEMAETLHATAAHPGCGLLQGFTGLSIDALTALSWPKQRLLIRYWLEAQHLSIPEQAPLDALLTTMTTPRNDAQPHCDLPCKGQVHRFHNSLYALPNTQTHRTPQPLPWPTPDKAPLIPNQGRFTVEQCIHPLALNRWPATLHISYRDQHPPDAPSIRIAGRTGSKTLKRWLQEYQVPPWLRSHLPLLYADGQLIAAVGLWITEGWQTSPEQCGYAVHWQPPWSQNIKESL